MNSISRASRPSSALLLLLRLRKEAVSHRFYSLTTKASNRMPAAFHADVQIFTPKPQVMSTELTWGYSAHNGPHTWAKYHEKAAGVNQSPVNIDSHRIAYDPVLERNALKLQQTTSRNGALINYGRGFRVEYDTDSRLAGGPLSTTYNFEQFHIHWGPSKYYGSEHTIDGRSYTAELHLVFIDRRRFPTFTDVLRSGDREALCVLGVFISEGPDNPILEPILQRLPNITYRDQKSTISHPLILRDLLPKNRKEYYTYSGSLTTPPCSEVVQWILYRDHITMSERQLNKCRAIYETLEDSTDHSKCDINCRTCCPLGSRVVRSSFPVNY